MPRRIARSSAECARCDLLKGLVFNRTVAIEAVTETQDDTGQPIEVWATERTLKAAREDVRGLERIRANQELGERTAVFTFRWFPGLHSKKRLNHDGLIWDIENIAERGRRVVLEVTATVVRV